MAEYYLRQRGRVSGPFEERTLGKMVRQGTVSRVDQVSSDGKSWAFVESLPGLFEDGGPGRDPPAVAVRAADGAVQPAGRRYFYARDGKTIGPVPEALLVTLAQRGQVRSDDIVWEERATVSLPAWRTPVLAAIYNPPTRASVGEGAAVAPGRPGPDKLLLLVATIVIVFLALAIPVLILIWKWRRG